MLSLLLALAACDAPVDVLPDDQAGPPPALEVRGVIDTVPVQVRLRTGVPRAVVRLLRSPYAPEAGPCLPALGGACLGLVGFETVADATADRAGVATFSFPADAAVGAALSLQAVVRTPRGARVTAPVVYRVLSARSDDDQDGLSNETELSLGMDPTRADSDGGGTVDRQEYNDGTDGADPADDRHVEADCGDRRDGDGDGLVDCADPDCGCAERCDVAGDEDRDGDADCRDPGCTGHPACVEVCRGGLDEDLNRRADCFDSDCAASPLCERACGDGLDDDQDGVVDCVDVDCAGIGACAVSGELCGDGVDNDRDNLIDCADYGCSSAQVCMEQCDNGVDDNHNGLVDCADPLCTTSPFCAEDCRNGADDDGDGLADCADRDCLDECREVCGDGLDNNGNSRVDCADYECRGTCGVERCDDGLDNDGDSRADCADADCTLTCREACYDQVDNDGDGLLDCVDGDCAGRCTEVCGNRRDDDLDGLVDCEDDGCTCTEQCTNGLDDDQDGLADCADPECAGRCGEDCANGVDDDRDGLVDCEDGACTDLCVETCGNGADDDGDQWVDCQDEECWSDPACPADRQLAWVVGGHLSTRKRDVDHWYWSGGCRGSRERGTSGEASDVLGFLSVSHDGRPSRCAWQVDRATFDHARVSRAHRVISFVTTPLGSTHGTSWCDWTSGEVYQLQRTGFTVAPGCGTSGSAFLPDRLLPSRSVVNLVGGAPWYGGGVVQAHPFVPSTAWGTGSAPGITSFSSTRYTNDPLRPTGVFGTCDVGTPALAPAARVIGGQQGVCVP